VYGDDGLSPDKMENNDRPVDFERLRLHVSQLHPCLDEQTLEGDALLAAVDAAMEDSSFQGIGKVLQAEIRSYFEGLVAKQRELPFDGERSIDTADVNRRGWNSCRISPTQLEHMMDGALTKCLKAFVEPGEAVGAIGAQSISEPGTQMTLKVRRYLVNILHFTHHVR
jgi:DNA-directed RNA polymerase III subunit RPC1